MQRVIRCDCGFEATGITDDDLVPVAQAHARAAHGTELAADLVRALARPHPGPGDPADEGRDVTEARMDDRRRPGRIGRQ